MSLAILTFRRAEIEARIEELIALLDVIDGDPDLEDGHDDEPWIGGAYVVGPNGKPEHDLEINGDELDTSFTEDDHSERYGW